MSAYYFTNFPLCLGKSTRRKHWLFHPSTSAGIDWKIIIHLHTLKRPPSQHLQSFWPHILFLFYLYLKKNIHQISIYRSHSLTLKRNCHTFNLFENRTAGVCCKRSERACWKEKNNARLWAEMTCRKSTSTYSTYLVGPVRYSTVPEFIQ